MNATVARIVELLFEDLEISEEVQAIKDEVMNNCQERYDDLLAAGMSEDDAIGAVVESLKGMEEVLAEYPRKVKETQDANDEDDEDDDDDTKRLVRSAKEVQRIELHLANEDVHIECSDDEYVHVECAADAPLSVSVNDGVLKVTHEEWKKEEPYNVKFVRNKKTFAFEGMNMEIKGFGDLFNALKNLKFTSGESSYSEVYIYLPEEHITELNACATSGDVETEGLHFSDMTITTTSGNVSLGETYARSLMVTTTSGDVSVELGDEDEVATRVDVRTTSGDVEIETYADECEVQSISGDIELEGIVQRVSTSSTSGDVELRADVQVVNFKTISGDVELICDSDELGAVNGKTTSGDIVVRLPAGVSPILNAQSRSGDINNKCRSSGLRTVAVNLQSASGDIEVR